MSIKLAQNADSSNRARKVVRAESASLSITATTEGCRVAEITHKVTGVNPLWTPLWPSIEPSIYDPVSHPECGDTGESLWFARTPSDLELIDGFGFYQFGFRRELGTLIFSYPLICEGASAPSVKQQPAALETNGSNHDILAARAVATS